MKLTDNLIKYLEIMDRKESEFYCKKCNKFMLSDKVVASLRLRSTASPKNIKAGVLFDKSDGSAYWIFVPRIINGKSYFRHTCLSCYKELSGNNLVLTGSLSPDCYHVFDISKEDLAKFTSNLYNTASEHKIIERHPEDGKERSEKYRARQAYTASSEYFINEKGMTPEETKEYHLSRAVTLPNMIRLHGEIDGPILYKSYCDKQITAGNTLESFIAKYPGDVEKGKAHYEAMLFKKTQGSKNNNPNSKVSMELFESILITYTKSVFYGKNEKTVNFKANNNRAKPYKPDFINLEDKKIIEFFGDYWHANPRKYKANDLIRRKETTAEMIWEKDRDKLNLMKDAGYEVLVIWEYDYNHDKAGTVVKCLEFLNS